MKSNDVHKLSLQVASEKTINPLGFTSESVALHVAYGTDDFFLAGCLASMASVKRFNKEMIIHFFIFINGNCQLGTEEIEQFSRQNNCLVTVLRVKEDEQNSLPTNKLWSSAIYYRFLMADYLASKVDWLLYLDSDVICNGSLELFTRLDLQGNIAGAVHERGSEWWKNRAKTLKSAGLESGYYNTGVIWFDLKKWASLNVTRQILALLNDAEVVKRLTFYDQDLFNLVLLNKVLPLADKYNVQFSINRVLKNTPQHNIHSAALIHYIGPTKPWFSWATAYEACQPFWNALAASPWQNMPSMQPATSMHYRYAYLHMKKQNKTAKMMGYFSMYLLKKVLHTAKRAGV